MTRIAGDFLIIREHNNLYILIHQHDHGLLAGDIAANWGQGNFISPSRNLVLTASLHDLSWVETDTTLQWNNEANRPYDFTSLPLEEKFPMYKKGLDQTERLNPYSALLTSMHYCSFFKAHQNEQVDRFLRQEEKRQTRLKKTFFYEPIDLDLRHLQLWDNLSLYVCLNEPGVSKEQEHPWFKNGINAVTQTGETVSMHAHWLNERTITLDPFPFRQSFSTTLPYYKAKKSLGPDDPDLHKRFHEDVRFVSS